MSDKFEIGQKVEVIKARGDYYKEELPFIWEVPNGWEGTVTRIGTTKNGLHYAYDLQGNDGTEIKDYPSPCLIPLIPGTKRKISKVIGNMVLLHEDNTEQAEFQTALNLITVKYSNSSIRFLLGIMYFYGKTVGMRQERQKKKLTQPKSDKQ